MILHFTFLILYEQEGDRTIYFAVVLDKSAGFK